MYYGNFIHIFANDEPYEKTWAEHVNDEDPDWARVKIILPREKRAYIR